MTLYIYVKKDRYGFYSELRPAGRAELEDDQSASKWGIETTERLESKYPETQIDARVLTPDKRVVWQTPDHRRRAAK